MIERSTISNNDADDGGGVYLAYSTDSLLIESSTISGNNANESGNAGDGGGIYISDTDDTVTVSNSTLSGNYATDTGGGVFVQDIDDGDLEVKNSTVNANRADGEGGGIYRDDTRTADSPLLSSTIIANNLPEGLAEESGSEGSFRAEFTLIEFPGNATISDQTPGSNIFNADPSLGPLTNNGGPTATHLPAADSLAIDAGIANGLANDQRGFPRTVDLAKANANGSDGTDIGAVERQTVEPPARAAAVAAVGPRLRPAPPRPATPARALLRPSSQAAQPTTPCRAPVRSI